MTKRKQLVSSGSTKLSSASGEEETDYFGWLSVDLVVKILSKLPLKTIAKCRCVSKLWSSIIRSENNNLLFPVKSSGLPRLVFVVKSKGKVDFCSSSQPQNPDKNSSLVVTHHHKHSEAYVHKVCSSVGGLVCSQHIGKDYTLAVITNPITGETFTTPRVKKLRFKSKMKIYFGYDPTENQFKVLCINTFSLHDKNSSSEYQVVTLGTGSLVWRKIQCSIRVYDVSNDEGICISGVLYMKAKKEVIACFDVKTEKINFIHIDQGSEYSSLIDYKGKLGAIDYNSGYNRYVLWVLEDAMEHKWSKHSYQNPGPYHTRLGTSFAGIIGSGGFVFYRKWTSPRFYIDFCNLEKNTIANVRLEIPTHEWVKGGRIHIFTNFVGDVKLM